MSNDKKSPLIKLKELEDKSKLEKKEKELKYEPYKFEQPYKSTSADRKLEAILNPGFTARMYQSINPKKSLGPTASSNIKDHSIIIATVFIFSLVVAILSTVMYTRLKNQQEQEIFSPKNLSEPQKELLLSTELIISALAISWFVFLNFSFLLFEATRFFNVLLFVALVALITLATSKINQNSVNAKIGIADLAMATLPLIILLYYYLNGDTEEITTLKTLASEQRERDRIITAANEKCNARIKDMKERLTQDVESEGGIRRRIANAYIDALVTGAEANLKNKAKPKEGDKGKDKAKEKEKKEEE